MGKWAQRRRGGRASGQSQSLVVLPVEFLSAEVSDGNYNLSWTANADPDSWDAVIAYSVGTQAPNRSLPWDTYSTVANIAGNGGDTRFVSAAFGAEYPALQATWALRFWVNGFPSAWLYMDSVG